MKYKETLIDCDCFGDNRFCVDCGGTGFLENKAQLCPWCNETAVFNGWHDCEPAQRNRAKLNALVESFDSFGRGEGLHKLSEDSQAWSEARAIRIGGVTHSSSQTGGE